MSELPDRDRLPVVPPDVLDFLDGDASEENEQTLRQVGALRINALAVQICEGCNMACHYCHLTKEDGNPAYRPMSPELFPPLLDFIDAHSGGARHFLLEIYGGEPLLAFDGMRSLVDAHQARFSARGVPTSYKVYTNATVLTDEMLDYLVSNRSFFVQVSIDGDQTLNDSQRPMRSGRGSFHRVVENARRLIAAMPDRVFASATADRSGTDAHRLLETFEFLWGLGFGQVSLNFSVGSGTDGSGIDEAFVEKAILEVDRLVGRYTEAALAWQPLGWQEMNSLIQQFRVREKTVQGFMCGKFNRGCWLTVGANGSFYPDLFHLGVPAYRLGDVRAGIDRERLLRTVGGLMVDQIPECQGCWAKYLCGGAMHIKQVGPDNRTVHNESRCELYRHLARRAAEVYHELDRANPMLHNAITKAGRRRNLLASLKS